MHENMLKTIHYYCTKELEDFRKSKCFEEISKLSDTLAFSVKSSFGESIDAPKNKHSQIIYLDISIVDKQGKTVLVNMVDYEYLSYATKIMSIDKKERIQFFSWEKDEDFIETIDWIKKELQKKVEKRQDVL